MIDIENSDKCIYLLSSRQDYEHALSKGSLWRESLDSEGFIHASPKDQLTRVANKYYKATRSPLILVLTTENINVEVKWEPAAGSLYPHIYGPLNMNAVVEVVPIALNKNGDFNISL